MDVQLDIFKALEERDKGIEAALSNADWKDTDWPDKAYEFLKCFLRNHNGPFMVEEVRSYAALLDFPLPPSARSWGGIITRAAREGIVQKAGYGTTKNVKAHGTPAALWRQVKPV